VQTVNFTCGNTLTDVRDGKTYPTALFNGKCWMTGNLSYGTPLPGPHASPQTDNCQVEKYCPPTDVNCTSLGGFYQWDELMQYDVTAAGKGFVRLNGTSRRLPNGRRLSTTWYPVSLRLMPTAWQGPA